MFQSEPGPDPPEPGGSRLKPKRRSFLPPPKAYKKATDSTAAPSVSKPPSGISSAVPSCSFPPSAVESMSKNPHVGDKVTIGGVKQGTVRFVGTLNFAEGEWYGIELDDGDGKNDGSVEGIQYFTCPPNHGIFAPLSKITLVEEKRTPTSPLAKQPLSPDKGSRLPQLKSRARSNSPESPTAKIPKTLAAEDIKPKSRLTRPKLLPPRHLRDEIGSTGSSAPSSRESSASPSRDDSDAGVDSEGRGSSAERSIKPPTKLSTFGADSKHPKKSGIPGLGGKSQKRSLPKPVTKPKEDAKKELNETYTVDNDQDQDKTFTTEEPIPEVTTPSRVDAKTALTLAYDLETENSDLDKQKLNLTFEVKKEKSESAKQSPASNASNSINSPIPDLLSTSVYSSASKGSPVDYPGDCMSESEDNVGFLVEPNSPDSHGSLGILDEQDLRDNSLLGDDLKAALGVKDEKNTSVDHKEVNKNWVDREFNEKDLDNEISGISTPEIDISSRSSTVSDKIVPSSPEPDSGPKRSDDFHLSDSSSPASPSHVKCRHRSSASESEPIEADPGSSNATYNVGSASDATFSVDRKASSVLMSKSLLAECPQEVKEEEDTALPMNASFELTRTAVTQYASLLEAAEKGRVNRTPKTDNRSSYHEDMLKRESRSRSSSQEKTLKRYSTGSDFSHIDFEHSKLRKLDLSERSKMNKPQEDDIEVAETEEEEQSSIIEELVSLKKERPTSTISSCSNDTGIVDDDDVLNLNKDLQRPVSMISTTSTDTGILSDFVDHCNGNSKKETLLDGKEKKPEEGGKRNSQGQGGGGEKRERPESLYSNSSVDTGREL